MSGLGGSVLGTVGAMVTRWQEGKQKLKEAEMDLRKLELMQNHELSMAEKQHVYQMQELAAQQEINETNKSYEALVSSIESDKASYSYQSKSKWLVFVDVVRGTMRPALTGLLVLFMMVFEIWLVVKFGMDLTPGEAASLITRILECLLVGANLALAWWFGARSQLGK
jgi:uncharacterized membrane protein